MVAHVRLLAKNRKAFTPGRRMEKLITSEVCFAAAKTNHEQKSGTVKE
jgi:hypothetical protein